MTEERADVDRETGEITGPKPKFTEWLAEHRNGVLDADLAEKFNEVIEQVLSTEKNGKLTVVFNIGVQGDMITVDETIAVKLPEVADPRFYWRQLDGTLSRNNPLQPRIFDHESD